MKKVIYLLLLPFFLSSCKEREVKCGQQACLTIFTRIMVLPQNRSGQPVELAKIDAKNMRTGKTYLNLKMESLPSNQIGYIVASDENKEDFSEQGDKVSITATTTTNTYSMELIIAGGKCACGITKISGSNTLIINE